MKQQNLFPGSEEPSRSYVEINNKIWFKDSDGHRVVFQGRDTPLYRIALGDKVEVRFVAVTLRLSGLARQHEIAKAFGHSVAAQRRWERRYQQEGVQGLHPRKQSGRPRKISTTQEACVRRWLEQGVTNAEMARRLGVSEKTIRATMKRLGLKRPTSFRQLELFEEKVEHDSEEDEVETAVAESPESPCSSETSTEGYSGTVSIDPLDRSADRFLARLGLLTDAEPMFAPVERLPRLGVLLAIPLLLTSGLVESFKRTYTGLGPAFYGLRTTVVCLFILALLRIKRPENLKEYNPEDLGRLLGLDRAPEVKTVRRKLDEIARRGLGMELMKACAARRVQGHEDPDLFGVLYCDGHVKEYHGQAPVGKAYISRRRLAAPAATDIWFNDVSGDPLFVVQKELNESLTQCLEPALMEVQGIVGEGRSITVIFDRGGWSPKLFYRLIQLGFHIITYRKSYTPRTSGLVSKTGEVIDRGQTYKYTFHDAPKIRVGKTGNKKKDRGPKYLWMRQVIRIREDGSGCAVITDRRDLPGEVVLHLMYSRWRQENFFKYMKEEFALDGLLEYDYDALSPDADRPNPEIQAIDHEIRKLKKTITAAQQELGELLERSEESNWPTVRGFKRANAETRKLIKDTQAKIDQLNEKKATLPKRVPVDDLVKLRRERDLIANTVKMTAYQVESSLVGLLADCYARQKDEARTLLHSAFQSAGALEVTPTELFVTLDPFSSPHRTKAIGLLCEKLNAMAPKFPGTNLRLRFEVKQPEPLIL